MKVLEKLEPVDVIAIIAIVGGFILMSLKIDTVVGGVITLIAGYYFGHRRRKEDNELHYEKIQPE